MGVDSTNLGRAAQRFLRSGRLDGVNEADLAAECSRIVRLKTEKSSIRAIELSRSFVRHARPYGGVLLQSAYRASGWAFLSGGHFRQAERAYLAAREMVVRDPLLRGRVDRVLIDVYMYLGKFDEARRRARMSLATFRKMKAHDEVAKTQVNFANLLHRQDRHREALSLYHEATLHFERNNDHLMAAFSYYNEANALVQLFEFDTASGLYKKAEKIFAGNKYDLHANGCRYGRAWLHMLEGKYHIALIELAECESSYEKASQPREVVLCKLDRAEAYLGLNLFTDVRRVAGDAEKLARKLGILYESSKAALFFARASMAMGRTADARRALKRAAEGFGRENNKPFLGTVELTSLYLENDGTARLARIRAARKRFFGAQLPLWEAICDLQILSESPDDRQVLRRLAKNPAVSSVPHLLARWHTMQGDRKARVGRVKAAAEHWRRACETLDNVRASLPPVDLRAAFLRNQSDPYSRLIQAELKQNPVAAAAWSERYRTVGLWQADDLAICSHPAREKAEKSLRELAERVTILSGRIEGTGGLRAGVAAQENEALHILQEKVRHDMAAIDLSGMTRIDRIESVCRQIYDASRKHPVIQFHTEAHDLIAFVHHRKQTRLYRYHNGARIARELTARWRFLVERFPYIGDHDHPADLDTEKRLLSQIGEWLLTPLELSSRWNRLLILPDGDVVNLPWHAVILRGRSLADEYELLLAPSIRHFLHAREKRIRSRRIEVFVGPADDLSSAPKEADLFSSAGTGAVTVHSPCRRTDWPNNTSAEIWHYVGHATFRRDNPFYSSLPNADGPMFAADFRLKSNAVRLVTLAACRTGQQMFLHGEESAGLVRSLLEMGARNVLASQWAISDESTSQWMREFYGRVLAGESIASSVRKTALQIREKYPSSYHWAPFSVFGAG